VRVVDVFANSTHAPITYPVALTKSAGAPAASYRQFLQSAAAASIFTGAGFTLMTARSGGMTSGCSGFAFEVSREMELLGGKSVAIAGGTSSSNAPALDLGKAYRVALAEQARVTFSVVPGKQPNQASAHAAVLRLAPARGRARLRVSLDQPAWVDLVSGGKVLESTHHTGSRDCPRLHKSVEFTIEPGAPLTLQLSNSAAASLLLVVTAPPGTGR
jgi:hypothetical protein